jgi:transposase InsO family protein
VFNRKWIADFTCVWTAEGWLYVAAIIDLFSRRVVGWSMRAAMTAKLVTDALVMAIWRRGKPDALLHHSDRGSQYTSERAKESRRITTQRPPGSARRLLKGTSRASSIWVSGAGQAALFAALFEDAHRRYSTVCCFGRSTVRAWRPRSCICNGSPAIEAQS